jgi:hypothetical protein
MTAGSVMAAFAEALMHVTRMTRCRVCGMACATADPEPGSWVARADYYYV